MRKNRSGSGALGVGASEAGLERAFAADSAGGVLCQVMIALTSSMLPAVAAVTGDYEIADRLIRQEFERAAGEQDAHLKGHRDFSQKFHRAVLTTGAPRPRRRSATGHR
jgi:hypothetical protein